MRVQNFSVIKKWVKSHPSLLLFSWSVEIHNKDSKPGRFFNETAVNVSTYSQKWMGKQWKQCQTLFLGTPKLLQIFCIQLGNFEQDMNKIFDGIRTIL